jgi:hypothetical protein
MMTWKQGLCLAKHTINVPELRYMKLALVISGSRLLFKSVTFPGRARPLTYGAELVPQRHFIDLTVLKHK